MALDRKFLQDVEVLIDIAHRASSDESAKANKTNISSTSSGSGHTNISETPSNQSSKKPKSRLSKIQKAFILAEILPRKY